MIIHVKEFGKIESADINMSKLAIFVGDNNSGKTYLMQLIYGLLLFFLSNNLNQDLLQFNGLQMDDHSGTIEKGNKTFVKTLEKCVNDCIEKNKDTIIKNTFHTDDLSIGKLSIEFGTLQKSYSFVKDDLILSDEDSKYIRYYFKQNKKSIWGIRFKQVSNEKFIRQELKLGLLYLALSELVGIPFSRWSKVDAQNSMLYLPASRSAHWCLTLLNFYKRIIST